MSKPLSFHIIKGSAVNFTNGRKKAVRGVDSAWDGLLFSDRPILINEKIELLFEGTKSPMKVGLSAIDPIELFDNFPTAGLAFQSMYFGDVWYAPMKKISSPKCVLYLDTSGGLLIESGGDVDFILIGAEVHKPLYLFFELEKKGQAVTFLDPPNRRTPLSSPAPSPAIPSPSPSTTGPNFVVYVRNFPQNWEKHDLSRIFSQFGGTINSVVVHATDKGKYAFVNFDDINQAITARDELNGANISGKELFVSIKESKGPSSGIENRPKTPKTPKPIPSTPTPKPQNNNKIANEFCLFIRDFPNNWNEDKMKAIFAFTRNLKRCTIVRNQNQKPHGFLDFADEKSMQMAMGLNGMMYEGCKLAISVKKEKKNMGKPETSNKKENTPRSTPKPQQPTVSAPTPVPQPGNSVDFSLYVDNFPSTWTDDKMRDIFTFAGNIRDCKIIRGKDNRVYAFANFYDLKSAEKALEMNGKEVDGRKLSIIWKKEKKEKREKPSNNKAQFLVVVKNWTGSKDKLLNTFKTTGGAITATVAPTISEGRVIFETKQQALNAVAFHNGTTIPGCKGPVIVCLQ